MSEQQSRDVLLNNIEKAAHDYEKEFHGCSRCSFKALQDHLDLGNSASLKASIPLAGGIAMRGETCGALLGGLLAVGIVTANEDFKDEKALYDSLAEGFRLVRKVEKEFGTIKCSEIQKSIFGRYYNIADLEQYEEFIKAGGYVECPKVVGRIARITAEFILGYLDKK